MPLRLLITASIAISLCGTIVMAQELTEAEKERIADRNFQKNQLKRRHKALGGDGNIDAIMVPLEFAALIFGNGGPTLYGVDITLEQAAVLAKKPHGKGGFTIGERLLYELVCNHVYSQQTQPTTNIAGNLQRITAYETKYYNMLGMPLRVTNHSSTFGFKAIPSTRIEIIQPTIWGNNTLTVRAKFEFVEPAVFFGLLKNRKYKVTWEKTGLQEELVRAVNQLIVLNSTIEDGQLVPMKPGFNVTPQRYMTLRVDEEGKLTARMDDLSKSDQKKLKDAHNNAGEFKDVKGVPVGEILAP